MKNKWQDIPQLYLDGPFRSNASWIVVETVSTNVWNIVCPLCAGLVWAMAEFKSINRPPIKNKWKNYRDELHEANMRFCDTYISKMVIASVDYSVTNSVWRYTRRALESSVLHGIGSNIRLAFESKTS